MKKTLYTGPGGSHREIDLKVCPHVGCPELIPTAARGCLAHRNEVTEKEAERRRSHPRNLIYRDARWRGANGTRRKVLVRDNWTCVDCPHYDPTGKTLTVDHVNEGGVLACPDPFDPAYCETRCFRCSGKKDGARGARRKN